MGIDPRGWGSRHRRTQRLLPPLRLKTFMLPNRVLVRRKALWNAFLSCWNYGVHIIDITNPIWPHILGWVPIAGSPRGVASCTRECAAGVGATAVAAAAAAERPVRR